MNERHQIMTDRDFWITLEFDLSGRLSQSHDRAMRKYWIDGFTPEFVSDTESGVNVEGEVWIAEGQRCQTKCRFLARLPQALLHRKIRDFEYEVVCLDIGKKYLELNIERKAEQDRCT